MLLKSIQLTNLLSYGESSEPIGLRDLNVLIGPNGSGKSNLIEALELLRAAPSDLSVPISEGGGVRDWLRKGGAPGIPTAAIDVAVGYPEGKMPLHYVLKFTASEASQRFEVADELLENEKPLPGHDKPYLYYNYQQGRPLINVLGLSVDQTVSGEMTGSTTSYEPTPEAMDAKGVPSVQEETGGTQDMGKKRQLQHLQPSQVDWRKSVLSQYRGAHYPELTWLGNTFGNIRIYREWSFGRYTVPRLPQKADLPNDHLEPDASNLGMVLNRMQGEPDVKKRLLKALYALYEGIDDFHVKVESGSVQVFFHEGHNKIPATRLSDGTLRYLCLLTILCDPNPGPLVCIEEPELGLHPDVLPTLSDLIRDAAERTQVIITTHSDILVDTFTDTPESVLVTKMTESGTHIERLDAEKLEDWLEKYRLGQLWTRGDIGGTRW